MNTLAVKGQWNIVKGILKQTLAHLTDDEIEFSEGKTDELVGRIQKRKAQEIKGKAPSPEKCSACHHQPKES